MPLVESAGPGLTPGPLAFSATASCRKEKKKQAKEERDRLKQAEKKKRRLEKALATAAAIRAELEKKKQRRKEEERRLDEEGAALAEAVALQVLVDEESDELGQMGVATEGDSQSGGVEERRCQERIGDKTESKAACFSVQNTEPVHHHSGLKRHGSFKYSPAGSDANKRETKEWNWNEWNACTEGQEVSLRYDGGVEGELLEGEAEGTWEFFSCAEETVKTSNERAQAAEAAAGLAAAQAVAALQIAEEARARAQAAKTAAEVAMNEALDHHRTHQKSEYLNQTSITAQCVEKERDELKGQLQETERKLHEKTCRVVELEHNLEEVTRYLLEFKAMVEGAKHCTQAMSDATRHDETGSEEGNA